MSGIGSWALSVFSKSKVDDNRKRDASVQTLLSVSGTANISKEWMFRSANDNDGDIDYIANEFNDSDDEESMTHLQKTRRKRIPDKPHQPLTLWTMLKDLVGQNLTNIALPVNINEPLTVLQRMTESFETSFLLDRAADCENIYDQIAFLAAFTISGYAVSAERTGKPFNPLLGETYEFDRASDLGWKCLVEQVSHRPSISALHCESDKWIFWEDLSADLCFRGKYIRVVPTDYKYVKFKSNQRTYRIERPETVIHNILFGKVWVDHCGKVEIICLDNDITCNLSFVPYSSFSRNNQRNVSGEVRDSSKIKRLVRGHWDKKVEIARNLDDEELRASTASFETVWERKHPKPDSSKFYNFSQFACELNELESFVAPTDSRQRPDLRMMEEGKWDQANLEKLRLEEKQRQTIYRRESENAALLVAGNTTTLYKPIWFVKTKMPVAGIDQIIYAYNGGYWEAKSKGDWSMCPDIFS